MSVLRYHLRLLSASRMYAFNTVGSSSSNSSNSSSSIGNALGIPGATVVHARGSNNGGEQSQQTPSRSSRSTSRESRAGKSPSVGWALHVAAPGQRRRQQRDVPEPGLLLAACAAPWLIKGGNGQQKSCMNFLTVFWPEASCRSSVLRNRCPVLRHAQFPTND